MTIKKNEILYMTRVAYLDAIALAFLGIQFVIPVAYILLLPIIPAIVALQVCLVSVPMALVSTSILIGLSFFVLGIDVGLWALVYVLTGCALGIVWRFGSSWFTRAIVTTTTAAASLLGVIFALSWITKISLAEFENAAQSLSIYRGLPLDLLFGVSIILIGFVIWLASDRLVSKVLIQLGDFQL
jgi:hypothetical protein